MPFAVLILEPKTGAASPISGPAPAVTGRLNVIRAALSIRMKNRIEFELGKLIILSIF